jgi:hypothetical protein
MGDCGEACVNANRETNASRSKVALKEADVVGWEAGGMLPAGAGEVDGNEEAGTGTGKDTVAAGTGHSAGSLCIENSATGFRRVVWVAMGSLSDRNEAGTGGSSIVLIGAASAEANSELF